MAISDQEKYCQDAIMAMLKNSQTKVIFPIITHGLLVEYLETGKYEFKDSEVKKAYHKSVQVVQQIIGHRFHTGGKYYDAYPTRNLPRYEVLSVQGKLFQIAEVFRKNAQMLVDWIPLVVKQHIDTKIGIIPTFESDQGRLETASDEISFQNFIYAHIAINPSNFEIFSFAILKTHLEKFACKIYRDTRTSSHDKGVDLSTKFGVVYQIKKLQLLSQNSAEDILSEIKLNFDSERLDDGKVVLIIDDISKDVKQYLIDMKVQSICKEDIIKICNQFSETEDRMKVLKVIFEEFRREYESRI